MSAQEPEELYAGYVLDPRGGQYGNALGRGEIEYARTQVMANLSAVGLRVAGDPVIRWTKDEGVLLKWRVASVPGLDS